MGPIRRSTRSSGAQFCNFHFHAPANANANGRISWATLTIRGHLQYKFYAIKGCHRTL